MNPNENVLFSAFPRILSQTEIGMNRSKQTLRLNP